MPPAYLLCHGIGMILIGVVMAVTVVFGYEGAKHIAVGTPAIIVTLGFLCISVARLEK